MVSRPFLGPALAVFAAVMLVLGWLEYFAPVSYDVFGVTLDPVKQEAIVSELAPGAGFGGLRRGDTVLLSQMTMSDRLRLRLGISPSGWILHLPIERGGKRLAVAVTSEWRPYPRAVVNNFLSFALVSTITLVILGIIAWRRPSIATAALVFFGAGTLTSGHLAALFTFLPNPVFGGVATAVAALVSTLPLVALIPFMTRFPQLPQTNDARLRMHIGDVLFVIAAVLSVAQAIYEPLLFRSWPTANVISSVVICAIVLVFAMFSFMDATGNDRRRIGWVIAGYVISVVTVTAFDITDTFAAFTGSTGFSALTLALGCALPIALAYAVLKHRVIDIGFAINRTLVYGAIIAVVIALVSLADWLTGKLIGAERLAGAVQALLTIGIGFAVTFIHRWTERIVDHVVFRQRHLAEKRIKYRINALDFSESENAVDQALTLDATDVLGLSSSAIFRRASAETPFAREAASGWPDGAARFIDPDALIVRTLRSMERPFFLDDVAIILPDAPSGESRPSLAVPIVTQHELTGFVLYGNHHDGSTLDPDEKALLQELAHAAGTAYANVMARRWRERATALEQSLVRASHA